MELCIKPLTVHVTTEQDEPKHNSVAIDQGHCNTGTNTVHFYERKYKS